MGKFKCENCSYETNEKRNYDKHMNRKIPCFLSNSENKLHGKAKEHETPHCEICDKDFATESSLKRHNKTIHADIIGDNNKQNNANIDGNQNKAVAGENNTHNNNANSNNTTNNNQTYTTNNTIINNNIVPYYQYDVLDLTLFEQYCIVTSKYSPYTSILDHLNLNPEKLKYNNIKVLNINKNIMDVHNGEEWEKQLVTIAMEKIITSQKMVIETLFNRFRIFLNTKALKLIPNAVYYGCTENYYYYKQIAKHIQLHLYNNRRNKKSKKIAIPEDTKHEIYWALSKNFTWRETEKLIEKLDKFNIDLNDNLDTIRNQIIGSAKFATDAPSRKLIKRIDNLIDDFRSSNDSDSDFISGSDDSESDSGSDDKSDDKSDDVSDIEFYDDELNDGSDDE